MGSIVWLHDPSTGAGYGKNAWREPEDGRVYREIRTAERTASAPKAPEYPLAFVERNLPPAGADGYLAARKQGARDLVLWADPHRQ